MKIEMKKTLKRSTLAVLIASLLPTFTYAQTMVTPDGSFSVPNENENEGVTADFIKSEADRLSEGASVFDKDAIPKRGNDYYVIDNNGQPIAENSTIVVNGLENSEAAVYGGYSYTTFPDNTNMNVVMKNGEVSSIYGLYYQNVNRSPSTNFSGNLYLTGDGIVGYNAIGAKVIYYRVTSDFSVTGNVYVTGNNVFNEMKLGSEGIVGASLEAPFPYNANSLPDNHDVEDLAVLDGVLPNISVTGSVYLTDAIVSKASVVGTKSLVDSSLDSSYSITGNVYLRNSSAETVIGAKTYSDYINCSSSAIGNVYLTNSTVEEMVKGVEVYTRSMGVGEPDFSFIGNISLNGSIVNGGLRGVDVVGERYDYEDDKENMSLIGDIYLDDSAVGESVIGTNLFEWFYARERIQAIGNVYLTNSTVVGDVIGGQYTYTEESYSKTSSFSARGNVYLYGNVKLQDDRNGITEYNSSIWGSKLVLEGNSATLPPYYNVFNDNRLSMGSSPLTTQYIGNFANYDFYLNDYNKGAVVNNSNGTGGVGLLTVMNSMQNNNTVEDDGHGGKNTIENKSTVHVAGISGVNVIHKGQSIVLIDASDANSFILGDDATATVNDISGLFTTQTGDVDKNVQVGLVNQVDIRYTVDSVNNKIIATVVDDVYVNEDLVNLNVKPLAEGRLATLENVTRGADLLFDIMGENKPVGTFTPFAQIDGSINTYQSGSHIDSRDYRLMVGSRYQAFENLYGGIALEYGRSNYDTTNELGSSIIRGNGHTYNYGASLFTKYTYRFDAGDIYVDGALRFGRTSTAFSSGDIVTGGGDAAHYRSRANYVGANIGLGFINQWDGRSSLDSSVRYLWTRLRKDSVVLDGDKVNFDEGTSSRLQLKEQYSYKSSEILTVSLAGIYEYEFDGKAGANVLGVAVDAPSVQGSTGIIEFAVKGTPITDKDFSFNINVRGYGGKRNGVSASAFIQYDF